MANSVRYTWHVSCTTENKLIPIVQKPKPSVCPNDPAHTISLPNTYYTVDLHEDTALRFNQDAGYYQAVGINFTAAANTTTTYIHTFDYNVILLYARIFCEDVNKGDTLDVNIGQNLTIGAVSAPASTGATDIYASSTSFDFSVKGISLKFGEDTTEYFVKNIDLNENLFTLTSPLLTNINPGTLIKRTVNVVKDLILPSKNIIYIGKNSLKRISIPAGFEFEFIYTNNDPVLSKEVNFLLDFY